MLIENTAEFEQIIHKNSMGQKFVKPGVHGIAMEHQGLRRGRVVGKKTNMGNGTR